MFPDTQLQDLTTQYAELVERVNEFGHAVRRIQNAETVGVGGTSPEQILAGVAVLPVSNLRGELVNNQPRLRWVDPVLPNAVIDHFNLYIVTRVNGKLRFDAIGSSRVSPALLPTRFIPSGASVVFTVQTVLANGQASVLEEGPTCVVAAPEPDETLFPLAPNVLVNPGFESGMTGWDVHVGPMFVQDGAQKHSGDFSARVTAPINNHIEQSFPAYEGQEFYSEMWYRTANVNSGSSLALRAFDAASNSLGENFQTFGPSAGVWTRVSIRFTAPTNTSRMIVIVGSFAAAGDEVWIDDVSVAQVDLDSLGIPSIVVTGLTVTNNSPGAGQVAWSTCVVHYNGTPATITAGNTSNAFITWTIGQTTFGSTNTYTPSVNVFLIATNNGGTHDIAWNKQANRSVSNDTIYPNLSAGKIVTGTLDAGIVNVTNLNASNISTGTLSANFINGGTINASNVTITNISATNVNNGTLDAGIVNVTNLNASNVTTGTLSAARIAAASLDITKLNIVAIIVVGTFTNNSPGAGSVAWSSTTVYHAGTAYSITGSNTNNRYVYWDIGNTTFSVTNTFTPANNRFLIATNIGGTHELVWNKQGASSIVAQHVNQPVYRFGPNGAFTLVDIAFTSNSPGAGSTAWSAGNATYRGVTYSIGSGNTGSSNFFIYWQLASPTTLQSSASYPSLGVDDFLVAFNDSGQATQIFEIHDGANRRVLVAPNVVANYNSSGQLAWRGAISSGGTTGVVSVFNGTGSGGIAGGQVAVLEGTGKIVAYGDLETASGSNGLLSYAGQSPQAISPSSAGYIRVRVGGTVYFVEVFTSL